MASNTSYTKNVNVERRTWDKEKYATLAAARAATEVDVDDPAYEKEQRLKKLKEEQGDGGPQYFKVASEEEKKVTGSERAYLKARTAKVDGIDSLVGTTTMVAEPVSASAAVSKNGVGWHCKVCDCYLKDSMTYLDHINGKKHQRNLGYSMRVEKNTTEQVDDHLESLIALKKKSKKRKQISSEPTEIIPPPSPSPDSDSEESARKKKKEEKWKRKKEEKERKKLEALAKEEEEDDDPMAEMKKMMGFGSFGS
ncbi:hypothetical protein TrST_g8326 [Triparma strigata]|uniref:Matrin-type domain-containing protein n=1 Tax=Triparma strigata TaxID=1606541 RepID=A0A9W7BYV7_9STRA|nr:hypothetical protein TrST_g8326 [Triparma strigata]